MPLDEKRKFLIDKILMAHGSNLKLFEGVMQNTDDAEKIWNRSLICTTKHVSELFEMVFRDELLPDNAPPPAVNQEAKPEVPVEPQAKRPNGLISEKQQRRLYAIAGTVGVSEEQLKAFLKEHYNINTVKEIPWKQYAEICTAVENDDIPF